MVLATMSRVSIGTLPVGTDVSTPEGRELLLRIKANPRHTVVDVHDGQWHRFEGSNPDEAQLAATQAGFVL